MQIYPFYLSFANRDIVLYHYHKEVIPEQGFVIDIFQKHKKLLDSLYYNAIFFILYRKYQSKIPTIQKKRANIPPLQSYEEHTLNKIHKKTNYYEPTTIYTT